MNFPQDARLYGILDLGYCACERARAMAAMMIEGGIDILQLRAKELSEGEIADITREVRGVVNGSGIPLIINDYPHLVPETDADGAHVGQDDMSVAEARRLAGPDKIIGKSTHSLEQARSAVSERLDYIGFGPIFATPTKPGYVPIGVEDIRRVHEEVPLPIFCIGGIKAENLDSVLAAGAKRVVIVSGILLANDVVAYTESLVRRLRTYPLHP
jgi:thiamine-phosphate pyrophosphorylase